MVDLAHAAFQDVAVIWFSFGGGRAYVGALGKAERVMTHNL